MAYTDPFDTVKPPDAGMAAPFTKHEAVTPSDTAGAGDIALLSRAIWVGGAGTIVLVTEDNVAISYTVPAGAVLPGRIKRVALTGTSATNIVAWT